MTFLTQAIIICVIAGGIFLVSAFGLGAHNPEPQVSDYPGTVERRHEV